MSWNKPLPHATSVSAPYWEGLKAHKVRLQQCEACSHWIFFPRSRCPRCAADKLAWRDVSGAAKLYTYTVARIPTLPEFADEMPQKLAVVELDEGPHLNTTLVGVQESELRIGMRLRPVFDERPGKVTLLRFAPVESDHPDVIAAQADGEDAAVSVAPQPKKRRISCRDLAAMRSLVCEAYSGWSNAITVTQEMINQFSQLSGDTYWIHTDPVKAQAQSPFGGTIAHGVLVQSLASRLAIPLDFEVVDFNNMVNYGSDRLRFPAPVPAGSRIHARARVKAVERVKTGVQLTLEIAIHVVGQERPSVTNDQVILYM